MPTTRRRRRSLAGAIGEAWPDPDRRPVVVLGMLADKDAAGVVSALAGVAKGFVATAPESPRALAAEELAAIVSEVTGEETPVRSTVRRGGGRRSRSSPEGVVVAGSLYTVGEASEPLRAGAEPGD